MKKILLLFLTLFTLNISAQDTPDWKPKLKKVFKFSTFYGAINGGTSLSDRDVFSVTNGLQTETIKTPYDYSFTLPIVAASEKEVSIPVLNASFGSYPILAIFLTPNVIE